MKKQTIKSLKLVKRTVSKLENIVGGIQSPLEENGSDNGACCVKTHCKHCD